MSTGLTGTSSIIHRLERPKPGLLVEEHEDGRIILSKETWTLIENGAVLERCRERNGTGSAGKETIIYLRDAESLAQIQLEAH